MNSFLYDTTGAAEILIFRRFVNNECRVTQNGTWILYSELKT